MKTNVAQTSLECFAKKRDSLGAQEMAVLDAMKRLPFPSNRDVAAFLHLEPSTVAGRTNALVENGYLRIIGRKCDKLTGMTVRFYEAV